MTSEMNIVEATIDELQAALSSGSLTSVDLVARYLRRISTYDCRGPALNSIPVLNTAVFDEAAASDDRRASGHSPIGALEGIPFTVKDSFKVKGMTVAAGSPAFRDLVANEDAFTVEAILKAGGVLIGRTNMPAMAQGGMQRGICGRAESPYNPEYLAAAFASGSSNGSGVSTAASFAAFGMGEETVSSGRAPASNNALVAYTPSRGGISIRGNWPLYFTCDVVTPHTRTMADMLALLDVITAEDPITAGDFWRDQKFVKVPRPFAGQVKSSLRELGECTSLKGLRFAVPSMYIGGESPAGTEPLTFNREVGELWEQARADLEALGAEVVPVPDFPVVTAYENPERAPEHCPRRPDNWHFHERNTIVAHGWDQFLKANDDRVIPDIASVPDPNEIYPDWIRTEPEKVNLDPTNKIYVAELAEHVRQTGGRYENIKGLDKAIVAIEGLRSVLLEEWLDDLGCQGVVFPAAGDVGRADADIDFDSAKHAWSNGVRFSHGNRALRHLGVPTVSVPMGVMGGTKMPMNLTFAGKGFDDANLLRWGAAFEKATRRRVAPPHTPALYSDEVKIQAADQPSQLGGEKKALDRTQRPELVVSRCEAVPVAGQGDDEIHLVIEGTITPAASDKIASPVVEITVDGEPVQGIEVMRGEVSRSVSFRVRTTRAKPAERDERTKTVAPVARDKTMVVILARARPDGRPSGWLGLV